jgi:hypothetical protein
LAIEAIPVRRKRLGISLAASADCRWVFPVLWRHLWISTFLGTSGTMVEGCSVL